MENDIVVNNAIDIDFIEKRTDKKVAVVDERPADSPDAAGKADGNSVAIFNPKVMDDANAKPEKTKKVDEVVKEREAKGIPQEEQSSGLSPAPAAGTDQNAQQPETGNAMTEEAATKPKKGNTADTAAPQDGQQNADEQAAKKKKKNAEQPANKDKKNKQECDPAVQDCPPAE